VPNNIIEKDRFSTGEKAAIIRVLAPVQSGSEKEWVKAPQNSREKKKGRRVVC